MSYDRFSVDPSLFALRASQSLWNRAVSYDRQTQKHLIIVLVSIPLEQGSVLRQKLCHQQKFSICCLNPFGTGQCLTTEPNLRNKRSTNVSIPLEQGSVLRPLKTRLEVPSRQGLNPFGTGQCLTTV